MSHARLPVAGIYTCGVLSAALMLLLLFYFGVFDGLWDVIIENADVRTIVKALLD
jgi:hypothetical protein